MKISSITPVPFKQNNSKSGKVTGPRTYIIRNSTVTLTAEEESIYRNSLRQTWQSIIGGTLSVGALTGLVTLIMSRGKNLPAVGVISLFGGLAGALGGSIEAWVTGKSRYTGLPYDKVMFENGMARHNLANMGLKEVKNEN